VKVIDFQGREKLLNVAQAPTEPSDASILLDFVLQHLGLIRDFTPSVFVHMLSP